MVHTGKPSGGCAECRRRRIKVALPSSVLKSISDSRECDERSPECSYCIRTDQKCQYRDRFDIAWRDQTNVAKQSVERRKRATEKERENPAIHSNSRNEFPNQVSRNFLASTILGQDSVSTLTLRESLEDHALCFFFTTYAASSRTSGSAGRYLEYVAPMYMLAQSESCMKMATIAVATCLFGAWMNRSPDTPVSRSFYYRAVSLMKDRVTKEKGCTEDDVLMAVMLLQMYESLLGTAAGNQSPRAHLDGALALIKHRGLSTLNSEISRILLFQVRGQLIDESFRNAQTLSEEVKSWANLTSDCEQSPNFQLDTINVELANLQALINQPLKPSSDSPESVRRERGEMLKKATEIENKLISWTSALPSSWRPIRVFGEGCVASSIRNAGLYQHHCDIYPNISIASIWNKYRLSRLKSQSIILSYLSHCPSYATMIARAPHPCQNAIQLLADDICASVPFHLGDRIKPGRIGDRDVKYPREEGREVSEEQFQMGPALGGYSLLGPLGSVMGMRIMLRDGQREWIGGQMRRIARIYNIGRKQR